MGAMADVHAEGGSQPQRMLSGRGAQRGRHGMRSRGGPTAAHAVRHMGRSGGAVHPWRHGGYEQEGSIMPHACRRRRTPSSMRRRAIWAPSAMATWRGPAVSAACAAAEKSHFAAVACANASRRMAPSNCESAAKYGSGARVNAHTHEAVELCPKSGAVHHVSRLPVVEGRHANKLATDTSTPTSLR